jgi:hypothetical protein
MQLCPARSIITQPLAALSGRDGTYNHAPTVLLRTSDGQHSCPSGERSAQHQTEFRAAVTAYYRRR